MTHLELVYTTQFQKDLHKVQKQGKKLEKLHTAINTLAAQKKLEHKHYDHPLKGKYVGYRECHVEPDWLLIYKVIEAQSLRLARRGSIHNNSAVPT